MTLTRSNQAHTINESDIPGSRRDKRELGVYYSVQYL